MSSPDTELTLRRLTRTSPDIGVILQGAFALSQDIFPSDLPRTSSDEESWRARLEHPSSSIFYLSAASEPLKPVGLLGVCPRRHDPALALRLPGNNEAAAEESMHAWIACVREDLRAQGCLGRMMQAFEQEGAPVLTVCTSPSRFSNMYSWLLKRGWKVEREFADAEGKVQLIKVQHTTSQ